MMPWIAFWRGSTEDLSCLQILSASLLQGLTMEGRSSWMSDMVWMNSIAQADGRACSMLPPTSSQAARQRAGLTRLPPASSEYLQAGLSHPQDMPIELQHVMTGVWAASEKWYSSWGLRALRV